jgi:tyrosinase
VKTVNALKNSQMQTYPFSYDSFVDVHSSASNAHGGVEFLPWHRRFLHDFETQLQRLSNDCSLTVPYWNWAEETGDFGGSVVWHANRLGSLKSGCIQDGLAAGWVNEVGGCVRRSPKTTTDGVLPSWKTMVETLEALPEYTGRAGVCSLIENSLGHGPVHVMIGGGGGGEIGDMATILSPRDPVFFLHHAFVDRQFYYWQEYHLLHKTSAVTNSCGDLKECNRLGVFNVMANEYMGAFDPVDTCVAIPASNPTTCLNYLPRSEGGWMSNTCAKVVGGLELGQCSVTSLMHDAEVDATTCDVKIDISEEYNEEWLKAMDEVHMQKGVGVSKPWQEKVADAKATFDLVRRELAQSPHSQAQNKDELVLCFRCADRWFTAECVDNPMA